MVCSRCPTWDRWTLSISPEEKSLQREKGNGGRGLIGGRVGKMEVGSCYLRVEGLVASVIAMPLTCKVW